MYYLRLLKQQQEFEEEKWKGISSVNDTTVGSGY